MSVITLFVAPLAGAVLHAASAATIPRTIQVEGQHRGDAVAITRVTLAGADVQCGLVVSASELQPVTPVIADDSWLQKVSFTVLNRTNKPIVFAQFTLVFPESGDGSHEAPTRMVTITLGRLPAAIAYNGSGQPLKSGGRGQALDLAAGQTLTVNLASYASQISSPELATLTKVIIRRSSVVFDDGMRWDQQGYAAMDRDNLGNWRYLESSFFPGTPVWPPATNQW
jgi:hypothetical protein